MLLQVQSQLEDISIANGYKTDVVTVEPFLRTREVPRGSLRPLLGFGFGSETYTHSASNNMRASVPWMIVGYIDTSSNETTGGWVAASAAMNNLIDDVIAALLPTTELNSLGGYATQTLLKSVMTSEQDPDREDDGAIVMELTTIYHRDTTAS
jgi:hypothetical protein